MSQPRWLYAERHWEELRRGILAGDVRGRVFFDPARLKEPYPWSSK